MQGTLKFFFITGFWVGLLILYLTRGKHLIKKAISKIDSVGKRHYMPYPYTCGRTSYKSRSKYKTYKTSLASTLSWIALVLLLIGFLAILGLLP